MLLLYDGADFVDCFLVFLLLDDLLPDFKMLPPELFSVFLIKYAFFFSCFEPMCYLLHQHAERVWNVTLSSCLFVVTSVLHFSFMEL
jgi:hypothetical protein